MDKLTAELEERITKTRDILAIGGDSYPQKTLLKNDLVIMKVMKEILNQPH